uniref:Uncharacterized protein n=1 Tax=Meloidogyne enterolobii TaxID=390850 RepID=A0A6V7X9Z4_MELEN|nr:unnamed protein product [Meloidogyne enterolobii]
MTCPPAIHSNDMVNAYKINFNNESKEFECELLTYEQTITTDYLYVLDNYNLYVDRRMEQIFSENNAQTIPEDWFEFPPKGRRQRKSRGESSRQPKHPQRFTVYSSEDSGNHSSKRWRLFKEKTLEGFRNKHY